MAENDNEVQTLEKGNVYFFYRPRVEEKAPKGLGDVQRFYMVLSTGDKYRLAAEGEWKWKPDDGGRTTDDGGCAGLGLAVLTGRDGYGIIGHQIDHSGVCVCIWPWLRGGWTSDLE